MPKQNNHVPKLDVKPEWFDELLSGAKTPGEINTLFKGLKKAILERALGCRAHSPPRLRQGRREARG